VDGHVHDEERQNAKDMPSSGRPGEPPSPSIGRVSRGKSWLELVSKLILAPIGCKTHGSAFSLKRVLDVLQHASEPFLPQALPMSFSLNLA